MVAIGDFSCESKSESHGCKHSCHDLSRPYPSIVILDFSTPISPFIEYSYTCKLVSKQSYILLLSFQKKMAICVVMSSKASFSYLYEMIYVVTTYCKIDLSHTIALVEF